MLHLVTASHLQKLFETHFGKSVLKLEKMLFFKKTKVQAEAEFGFYEYGAFPKKQFFTVFRSVSSRNPMGRDVTLGTTL
jgi:hypothetical protein